MYGVCLLMCVVAVLVACDNKAGGVTADNAQALGPAESSQMLKVAAGTFIRGSNKEDDTGMRARYGFATELYQDEHPEAKVHVDEFLIDTYEVTNKAYKEYISKTKRMMPFAWVNNGYALDEAKLLDKDVQKLRKLALDYFKLDMDTRVMEKPALIAAMRAYQVKLDLLPVSGVNWFDAKEFCQWRTARLPTELEWEKAARGENGLEYPWGHEWDARITNTGDDGLWDEGLAPVGSYQRNKSPYGAYDMSGNVWEWVSDWYEPYPGSSFESAAFGKARVIRGGGGGVGHYAISYFFRGATRQFSEPEMESDDVGFRCAKDA